MRNPNRATAVPVVVLLAAAAGVAAAGSSRLRVEGRFEWTAPEGWEMLSAGPGALPSTTEILLGIFGPPQPCGDFETNVVFRETAHPGDDLDRALADMRSAPDLVGYRTTVHRAEITYPGHRVNVEMESTVTLPDNASVRQLTVLYPARQYAYLAVYSTAEKCFSREKDAIRASVASFRDASAGPGQAPTVPRKSTREVLVGVLTGVASLFFLLFLWRRFRR